jgi:putative addiction module killer protein
MHYSQVELGHLIRAANKLCGEENSQLTVLRLKERLDRVALGNLGDYKQINKDIFELRLAFGAGYRIYFYEEDRKIVLLLSGGNKSTQKKDIKKAMVT